jgi:hypothetical protein
MSGTHVQQYFSGSARKHRELKRRIKSIFDIRRSSSLRRSEENQLGDFSLSSGMDQDDGEEEVEIDGISDQIFLKDWRFGPGRNKSWRRCPKIRISSRWASKTISTQQKLDEYDLPKSVLWVPSAFGLSQQGCRSRKAKRYVWQHTQGRTLNGKIYDLRYDVENDDESVEQHDSDVMRPDLSSVILPPVCDKQNCGTYKMGVRTRY